MRTYSTPNRGYTINFARSAEFMINLYFTFNVCMKLMFAYIVLMNGKGEKGVKWALLASASLVYVQKNELLVKGNFLYPLISYKVAISGGKQ